MVARTTPAGNQTPGTPAPSSFANGVAGGWIGYVERTTDLTPITTTELTAATVSVTVNSSRRIKITAYFGTWNSTVANDRAQMRILEGATQLQLGRSKQQDVGVVTEGPTVLMTIETPTAGSHTYSAVMVRNAGTGTITLGCSVDTPSFILVEDVGPA